MSAVLENPRTQPRPNTIENIGQRLQSATTAVRLHIRWPGVRKSLSRAQKLRVASAFDADCSVVSAAKKLLDTSHPSFRAVSNIRTNAIQFWKAYSLPYVESGVRLIKREDVDLMESTLRQHKEELSQAVEQLDGCYGELVMQARSSLGDLFDAGDYAVTLRDMFELRWDFPAVTPPDYLRSVSPEVYATECSRVRERFNEAVQLAEATFTEELSGLVNHLAERLSGESDGRPKIFRDTALTNLTDFFDRFSHLNITSDEALQYLVDQARGLLGDVHPTELREQNALRQRVANGLVRIEASLDGLLADRPRRNILRKSSCDE
jgi:hypothetical protein